MPEAMSDEITRQDIKDEEYRLGWANAPQSFLAEASALGIKPDTDRDGMAINFDESKVRLDNPAHADLLIIPDMAASIDTHVDAIVEKYPQSEALVREIAAELQGPMKMEIQKNQAILLGLIVGELVQSESKNIHARVHQLLHAVPRMAAITGFSSLRKSAIACGVSPEWMRRGRDSWCNHLGIPVPKEGRKSDEAKAKYKARPHWRYQLFTPKGTTLNLCKIPIPKRPKHLKTAAA